MEAIDGLLVVALVIFSIYNLISHMGNHGNLKKSARKYNVPVVFVQTYDSQGI